MTIEQLIDRLLLMDLNSTDMKLALWVYRQSNKVDCQGETPPISVEDIAKQVGGVSEPTISKAKRKLIELNIINVVRDGNGANKYSITHAERRRSSSKSKRKINLSR